MQEQLYEDYVVLDAKIKALNNDKDELRSKILDELVADNLQNIDTAVGKFTISQLKTWTYTPKVTKLEEDYEALKATEQSTGDATFKEKPSLRFTQLKI